MEQQEHIQKLADEYYEEGRARFFDHKLEEAAMLYRMRFISTRSATTC